MTNLDHDFYLAHLYPLQNRVLENITGAETEFYLTGGTAASRGYLHHRFSDDLDFFVNDDPNFPLWSQRLIQALIDVNEFHVDVLLSEERFTRLNVVEGDTILKLEMINDVPAHVGEIRVDPVLGRLDSAANILANKITALIGREEPKDLADIWGFCCQKTLSLEEAIKNAHCKAAGIFPADLARILCSVSEDDWRLIRWIEPPPPKSFTDPLHALGEQLLGIQ